MYKYRLDSGFFSLILSRHRGCRYRSEFFVAGTLRSYAVAVEFPEKFVRTEARSFQPRICMTDLIREIELGLIVRFVTSNASEKFGSMCRELISTVVFGYSLRDLALSKLIDCSVCRAKHRCETRFHTSGNDFTMIHVLAYRSLCVHELHNFGYFFARDTFYTVCLCS